MKRASTPLKAAKAVLFLLLLTGVVLLLIPIQPQGSVGFPEAAEAVVSKLDLIEGSHSRGVYGFQTFYEYELNAYLKQSVDAGKSQEKGLKRLVSRQLDAVNLNFTTSALTVVISARWSLFPLSILLEGPLTLEKDALMLDVNRIQLGKLPLPRFLGRRLGVRVATLFRPLKREYDMAQRLLRFTLQEDRIKVAVKPEKRSQPGPTLKKERP